MGFLRWGEMSITEWFDKKILFLSTVNIFKTDTEPQDYPKKQKGRKGKTVGPVKQPVVRQTYVKRMRGVDVADQKGGTYVTPHRPKKYFWRRVFEQKLMQAVVNAYIRLFSSLPLLPLLCRSLRYQMVGDRLYPA